MAADLMQREVPDEDMFEPCDVGEAVTALESFPDRGSKWDTFIQRYRCFRIMDRLTDEVLEVAVHAVFKSIERAMQPSGALLRV